MHMINLVSFSHIHSYTSLVIYSLLYHRVIRLYKSDLSTLISSSSTQYKDNMVQYTIVSQMRTLSTFIVLIIVNLLQRYCFPHLISLLHALQ